MANPEITVALGPRRYRLTRGWGRLPKGLRLGQMSKVAADSKGNVYVFQRIDPPVVVFDRNGDYLRSWGQGMIADGHGIFIAPDDRVWLVDRGGHQVMVFDPEGRLLFTVGDRQRPRLQAPFNHPTDVAVAPNGDFYVSDGYANSMVHWFSADGTLRRSWGGPGSGPGKFTTPHGIWVLADGRVLVGDRENNRIQIFDPEGGYLTEWRDLYKPMDVFADRDGIVYVADQIPRTTALTADGTVVGRCMPVPKEGHGIRGDAEGNIYVAETVYDYVARLEPIRA
ncbi:MAG: peptidase [Proteobacteria bacterium]|nr:peptidase [Pseudomonadota bacterium]